jgi:signal peptidase I
LVIGLASFFLPDSSLELAFGLLSFALGVFWAWRAYRLAAANAESHVRRWYSRWYGLTAVAAVVLITVSLLRIFLYEPFRAPSTSMQPSIMRGSTLLVQKWGYGHFSTMGVRLGSAGMSAPIQRGDIMAFDYPRDPGITYLKRVVGLPGDLIVYRDKHLFVNGVDVRGKDLGEYLDAERLVYLKRYREKLGQIEHDILINDSATPWHGSSAYELPDQCTTENETIRCTVPAASYFVMGDNRDNSLDSRFWGFVSAKAMVGKVVYIVAPRS